MKKTLTALALLIPALLFAAKPLKVDVMSFNIRLDTAHDSINRWDNRKDFAANAVRFYNPDILGTQEVLPNQLEDLKERLPQYTAVGVGREDGIHKGEHMALFYKTERFDSIATGTFWLSETPDKPGVKGWDAACPRTVTWALLKDRRTGREFLAMNTHLDHVGETARREGMKMALNRAFEIAKGAPIVLTGDFNTTQESTAYQTVTNQQSKTMMLDSRKVAATKFGPEWTFHDFGRIPYADRELIDYIFVTPDAKVLRHGVLTQTEGLPHISDHAPITATIIFQ